MSILYLDVIHAHRQHFRISYQDFDKVDSDSVTEIFNIIIIVISVVQLVRIIPFRLYTNTINTDSGTSDKGHSLLRTQLIQRKNPLN